LFAFIVTALIVATGALGLLVFAVVAVRGLWRNVPLAFCLPVPSGSHSVRLFAVMLAGHITLKVFAGFIFDLSSFGPLGMAATSRLSR
jgi:F-type H+-transporting ATPase subunit a